MTMKILLIIFLIFTTKTALSETTTIHIDSVYLNEKIEINANHYTSSSPNNTVAISIHGTRGFKTMEIISVLSDYLLDLNIDTIAPNISYGINDRKNEFLPCDIKHHHNRHANIEEIAKWFSYAIKKDYQNIILIGHSRGGQDVVHAYTQLLKIYPKESKRISSIILLAPLTDNVDEINDFLNKNSNITIRQLLNKDADALVKVNFLNCVDTSVRVSSLLSYYNLAQHEHMVQILKDIELDTYIFTASEDTFVPKTYSKISNIDNIKIKLIQIEGSDHFFRDLFLDEVIENLSEFIE